MATTAGGVLLGLSAVVFPFAGRARFAVRLLTVPVDAVEVEVAPG